MMAAVPAPQSIFLFGAGGHGRTTRPAIANASGPVSELVPAESVDPTRGRIWLSVDDDLRQEGVAREIARGVFKVGRR